MILAFQRLNFLFSWVDNYIICLFYLVCLDFFNVIEKHQCCHLLLPILPRWPWFIPSPCLGCQWVPSPACGSACPAQVPQAVPVHEAELVLGSLCLPTYPAWQRSLLLFLTCPDAGCEWPSSSPPKEICWLHHLDTNQFWDIVDVLACTSLTGQSFLICLHPWLFMLKSIPDTYSIELHFLKQLWSLIESFNLFASPSRW